MDLNPTIKPHVEISGDVTPLRARVRARVGGRASMHACHTARATRGAMTSRSSGYLGVRRTRGSLKWEGRIKLGGRQRFLGSYFSEVAAAEARDKAVIALRGRDAQLNFHDKDYSAFIQDTESLGEDEVIEHIKRASDGFGKGASTSLHRLLVQPTPIATGSPTSELEAKLARARSEAAALRVQLEAQQQQLEAQKQQLEAQQHQLVLLRRQHNRNTALRERKRLGVGAVSPGSDSDADDGLCARVRPRASCI